jgi:hypothetical protein
MIWEIQIQNVLFPFVRMLLLENNVFGIPPYAVWNLQFLVLHTKF